MTIGQRVWIGGRDDYFSGTVIDIHTERGILVKFDHQGGAWMMEHELYDRPKYNLQNLKPFQTKGKVMA